MNIKKINGYVYYYEETSNLKKYLVGKWMYFFNDKEFASKICSKAITEKIVDEAKHSDSDEGVACFYINVNDLEAHKRVITFFLDNQLIRHKKRGGLYNISFKLDSETHNGQYKSFNNYNPSLSLKNFVDLDTEQWILSEYELNELLPYEARLLALCNNTPLNKSQFGSECEEDYIHKAFPDYLQKKPSVKGKTIHFWKGGIPHEVLVNKLYYIVRFQAIFYLKYGKTPFIICKTSFMYPWKQPLETSDIRNPADGKYYDRYIDFDKKVKKCFPEFTLTRDDFSLFHDTYDIEEIKILDGCYFK